MESSKLFENPHPLPFHCLGLPWGVTLDGELYEVDMTVGLNLSRVPPEPVTESQDLEAPDPSSVYLRCFLGKILEGVEMGELANSLWTNPHPLLFLTFSHHISPS